MAGPEETGAADGLVARLSRIEIEIKNIKTALSDINDLQLINKLDIINLQNELEKLKMVSAEMPLEEEEVPPPPPEKKKEEKPKEKKPEKKPEEKPKKPEKPEEKPKKPEKPEKPEEKPKEPKKEERDFIVCEECKAILPPGAKFCGRCGNKVRR